MLKRLDLSYNRMKRLMRRLEGLNNLAILDLSNNMLEEFDCRLGRMRKVDTLLLRNNMIQQLPNISEANELSQLSLRNQNGRLRTINHYSFERSGTPKKTRIDLRQNQIAKFENKVKLNSYLIH